MKESTTQILMEKWLRLQKKLRMRWTIFTEAARQANLSGYLLSGHKGFQGKTLQGDISEYEKAKDKSNEKARESAEKQHGNPDKEKDKEATPFR